MDQQQAEQLFNQAGQLFQQGQYEQALNILGQLNQAFPNSGRILMPAAQCMEKLGRTQEAQPLVQQLVQMNHPGAQDMQVRLGGQATAPPPIPDAGGGAIPGLEGVDGIDLGDMGDIGGIGGLDNLDMGGAGGIAGLDMLDSPRPGGAATPRPQLKATPAWIPIAIASTIVIINLIVLYFIQYTMQNEALSMLGDISAMDVPSDATMQNEQLMQQHMATQAQPLVSTMLSIFMNFMLLGFFACIIPGILGLWCALKVVGGLPEDDFWEDIKHISITHVINVLLSTTIIGYFVIPFILMKRYEQSCGSVFPIMSLYVLITFFGTWALIFGTGAFLPDPMESAEMIQFQEDIESWGEEFQQQMENMEGEMEFDFSEMSPEMQQQMEEIEREMEKVMEEINLQMQQQQPAY